MINDCNRYGFVTSKCIFRCIPHVKMVCEGISAKYFYFFFNCAERERFGWERRVGIKEYREKQPQKKPVNLP